MVVLNMAVLYRHDTLTPLKTVLCCRDAGGIIVSAPCLQLERVVLPPGAAELSKKNERRPVVRLSPVQRPGLLVLRGLHR